MGPCCCARPVLCSACHTHAHTDTLLHTHTHTHTLLHAHTLLQGSIFQGRMFGLHPLLLLTSGRTHHHDGKAARQKEPMSLMTRPEATCSHIQVVLRESAVDSDQGGVIPTLDFPGLDSCARDTDLSCQRHFYFGFWSLAAKPDPDMRTLLTFAPHPASDT